MPQTEKAGRPSLEAVVLSNVEHFITAKGLRKAYVAEQAGLTPQALTELLHGRTRVRIGHLLPLADALGVSVDDLMKERRSST